MRINSFVSPDAFESNPLQLSPEESHHLARVLRVEAGQSITLLDGQGTRAEGIVETVTKRAVHVRIISRQTDAAPTVEITLMQAVCKPDRFELILQKATELGVQSIQPILTKNASLPAGKIGKMIARGEPILRHAMQQCGTAWLPRFHPICRTNQVMADLARQDLVLIGSLHPNARPLKEVFSELDKSTIRSAALLIGPEGDFTADEVQCAVDAGAIPVTFGDHILRTETAALFGLSVLVYELS